MQSGRSLALGVVVTGLVAAGAYWLGTNNAPVAKTQTAPTPPAKAAGGPPPVAVDAARVKVAPLPKTISAVGSLRSDETVIIRPEASGRIAEILFREGERVTKGSVLVRLDQSVQRAELKQAEANLALAKSRLERARDLHAKQFISSQAKDESESSYRIAAAAFDLANARLTKLDIRAPFSGIVGLRQAGVGDFLREGQDIVNLESVDPLKVDFRIPELFLKEISPRQSLEVSLDAVPGKNFAGQIYAVNPLIDASGRAIVIRAIVRNTDSRLRPGMFARIRLITDERQEVPTIPEQALVPLGDEFFVFRVVEGRAQRTRIEIGQRRSGVVEVVRGLSNSDVVVTAGQPKLRDGGAVRLASLDGTPTAEPTASGPTSTNSPTSMPSPSKP
jgi:membrane fusion protein (multidrug efflux system)